MSQNAHHDRDDNREFDYEKFLRKWKDRIDSGRFPECEKLCLKGLRMHPAKQDRSKLYNHLGYLYENFLDDKTFDDILEQYVLSLQVNHANPSAHYNLAMFLLDQSMTHLERAVEIKPNHKKAKKKLEILRAKNVKSGGSSSALNTSQSALLPLKTILQLGDEAFRIEEQTQDGYRAIPLRIKSRGTRNIPTIYDEKRGAPLVDLRHELKPSSSPGRRGNSRLPVSKSVSDLRRGGSYSSHSTGRRRNSIDKDVPRIALPEFEEDKDQEDELEYSYRGGGNMRGKERPNRVRDINTPRKGHPDDPDTDGEYSQSRSRVGSVSGRNNRRTDSSRLPPIPDNVPIRKSWPQCLCGWIVLGTIGIIIMLTGLLSETCTDITPAQTLVKQARVSLTNKAVTIVLVKDCSVAASSPSLQTLQHSAMKHVVSHFSPSPDFNAEVAIAQSCGASSPAVIQSLTLTNINSTIDNLLSTIPGQSNLTEMARGIGECQTFFTANPRLGATNLCITFNVFPPSDVTAAVVNVRQLTSQGSGMGTFLQVAVVDNATAAVTTAQAEELYTVLGSMAAASVQPAVNSTPSIQPSVSSDTCSPPIRNFCSNCIVDTSQSSPCAYLALTESLVTDVSLTSPAMVRNCSPTTSYLYLLFLLMPLIGYATWLSCTMSRSLIRAATAPPTRLHSQSGRSRQAAEREETATTIDTTIGKDTVITDIDDGPLPKDRTQPPKSKWSEEKERPPQNNLSVAHARPPPDIQDDDVSLDDDVSYSGELVRIEFPQEGGSPGGSPRNQSQNQNQGKLSAYV